MSNSTHNLYFVTNNNKLSIVTIQNSTSDVSSILIYLDNYLTYKICEIPQLSSKDILCHIGDTFFILGSGPMTILSNSGLDIDTTNISPSKSFTITNKQATLNISVQLSGGSN